VTKQITANARLQAVGSDFFGLRQKNLVDAEIMLGALLKSGVKSPSTPRAGLPSHQHLARSLTRRRRRA